MEARSNLESTYELEIIRPASIDEAGQGFEEARKSRTSLSDNKQDTVTYLERELVPEEGLANVVEAESPPPDGGYGWVIVGACFIITLVTRAFRLQAWSKLSLPDSFFYIGSVYSFGVILTRLKEDGLASSSTLSFAGGLTSAMISCLAIVNSNIIKRYGSKAVLCSGVFILGLGHILSGWTVKSIGGLFVTLGLVCGLGTSLIFMASPGTA